MEMSIYLLIANIAVWLGIAGYVAFLAGRQRQLYLRLIHLEMVQHDHKKK
ncbi:conserved hypothetical protein [Desulfovibrionales bacterium]